MSELIIAVPSRERPRSIRELSKAFEEKCVADTLLVVIVDDDDPEIDQYCEDAQELGAYELVIGPRRRIGPTLNYFMPEFAERAPYVGFMGDDHRPRTMAWDQLYINNLRQMGTGIIYGNDLIVGEKIPTQVAMTSDIVKATGHFVPDGMIHLWLDNVWKSLGQALGSLRYLPDVVVEHLHPFAGKAEWDRSYRENNARQVFEADRLRYEEWKAHELFAWVEQIRSYNRADA